MPEALRVLIAENEASDAELVVRELRRAGFAPDWRRVETEADYLAALSPDLDVILSDYSMPTLDGPRALQLLQESGLDVPFILVSGTVGEDAAVAAMKNGANDYLLKDRLARLGTAVRHAIAQRAERQQRKRAEAELRRFVSASPAVIYALTVKEGALEHLWTSDNVTRLTGHPHSEAVSTTWWADNLHPEDRDRVLVLHYAPYVHEHLLLEYRFRRKDGSFIWIRDEKRLSRDGAGQPIEVVGSWADVTERKEADQAIVEWKNRYEAAIDASGQILYDWDAKTNEVTWGGNIQETLGYGPEEMTGGLALWLGLIHPDDLAAFEAELDRVMKAREAFELEYRVRREDGVYIFVDDHGYFLLDAAGAVARIVGFVTDITKRKEAEATLREAAQWQGLQHAVTRVLADSASLAAAAPGIIQAVCQTLGGEFGAVWEIDRQVSALRCAALWRAPGLQADELEAQTRQISFATGRGLPGRVWGGGCPLVVVDVARDPDFPRAAAALKAGLRGAFAFPIPLRDGVTGVIDFLSPEMREPKPELLAMLSAIGTQIGQFIEHRAADQQLLQAQKMEAVGQLAGGIAHDFNNLLGVILGYAQLASREIGPEHKTNRRLDAVCKAAERAAALTRQILTFSRKQAVNPRVCDLNHVVEDMEKMLRRLIGEDVRLAVALGEDLGRVRADPGQLEQVIMNLAVNARDAMPSGGRLVIETANVELDAAYARSHPDLRPGPHVMLAVGDTGEGMGPGTVSRIFEPFFTTKEPGKGTGLGLAVVFGIVKQSGGSLSVYSELGYGSTFKVYLPRVDAGEPVAETASREMARGGSETLLLLEDEAALRDVVAETLRGAGYSVLEAADPGAAAAIAAQNAQAIRLLITDVVLPGQSGPATAAQIANLVPGLRVLLMSGYTDRLVRGDTSVDPAMPFLEKPFTVDAVLRKVREVLDHSDPGSGLAARV